MHLRPSLSRRLFAFLLGLTVIAMAPPGRTAVAVAPPGQTADPTTEGRAVNGQQGQVAEQLNQTLEAIETKEEQIKDLRERLKTTPAGEKAEVETQIAAAERSLDASQDHFDALAMGGVSLGTDEGEKPLYWQTELLEIAKPLVSSLKTLTEKPRTMDRLRSTDPAPGGQPRAHRQGPGEPQAHRRE